MNNIFSELSKTKQLQYKLIEEIKKTHPEPHSRFYSEKLLVEKYKINRTTVRESLKRLVDDGYLYKINGKGTFIAPRVKNRQILIITKIEENPFNKERYAQLEFLNGIYFEAQKQKYRYICMPVSPEDYESNLKDIELIYQNLSGIIFYSDPTPLLNTSEVLKDKKIPYYYYGSDLSRPIFCKNYRVYPQKEIVSLALDTLIGLGHQSIGLVHFPSTPPRNQRYDLFMELLKEKKLPISSETSIKISYQLNNKRELKYTQLKDQLKEFLPLKEITAVICVDDLIAQYFLNTACQLNQNPPESFSIIGINNYPFCPDLQPSLSSISIPFFKDGKESFANFILFIEGEMKNTQSISKIEFIERQSTARLNHTNSAKQR